MSTYKARKNALSNIKLLATSALTAAGILALGTSPALAIDANTTPTGGNITGGSGSISQSGVNTNVQQNSQVLSIDWQSFNHGKNAVTQFYQPNSRAWALNTVVGNIEGALGTIIDGTIIANGNIGIADQNGVIFGANARIDTNSFVATTGRFDASLLESDSRLEISNFGDGTIEIQEGASINVAQAGLAAFVSPAVANNGIINAKLGTVAFAAGEKATIDLYGDGLFEVEVEGELADAYLENKGEINAAGGTVQMTALAAKDAVDNIINVEGIVTVASAEQIGGKIVLSGGNKGVVSVSGNLDASGATGGGDVEITGQNVDIAENATINIGTAGENGDGGEAYIYGDDYAIFRGFLLGRGGSESGDGANAEISAGETVGYYGFADLGALNGETGTLLIDPRHLNIGNASTSGVLADLLTGGTISTVNINSRALADTLANANVNLWATETVNTTSDIDLSVGTEQIGTTNSGGLLCALFGCPVFGDSITEHNLTLAAPTVNLDHNITLGTGSLNVADISSSQSVIGLGLLTPPFDINVDTLNLDGKIYTRTDLGNPAFTELVSDSQINTTADTINVKSNKASIQQAIQFADAEDADNETVNVSSGTYTENLVIDRALKLDGNNATLRYDSTNPTDNLITVTASNVNIDPFTFDGLNMADYGINATALGAIGLVVDGNTFRNFTKAGVFVAANAVGTGSITGNTFQGSSTRGIETGTLNGGYTLNITNNTMGSASNEVLNGLLFGQVRNATLNISGGTIRAGGGTGSQDGDAIHFKNGTFNSAEVNISDINVISSGDEAIDFQQAVRSGSTVNITGNFTGGNNGIEFNAIAGNVNIGETGSSTTLIAGLAADKRGINLLGSITGLLNIDNAKVYGTDDAIGSNDDQNNTLNGGTINILNSRLAAATGDGLELGAVTDDASLNVTDSVIWAEDNGIHFVNGVDDSTINVTNSSISAEGTGIVFAAGSSAMSVSGGSEVTISGKHSFFNKTIHAKENGILFSEEVTGGSTITVDDTEISTLGISVAAQPNGTAFESGSSNPSPIAGDAIQFNGVDDAIVTITNSAIQATNGNGIAFNEGSPSLDGATVDISSNAIHGSEDGIHITGEILNSTLAIGKSDTEGNTITAGTAAAGNGTLHDGIYFGGDITGTTRVLIGWNDIDSLPTTGNGGTAMGDMGIRFDGFVNTSAPGTSGVGIVGNDISAGGGSEDRGISFWNGIGGESTVRIAGNTIEAGDDGIGVFDTIDTNKNQSTRGNANLIIEGNTIGTELARVGQANSGDGNGIDFQSVTGNSNVTISGNDVWSRKNAVEFDKIVNTTGTVTIANNTNLDAASEDGIQFAAGVTNASVEITDNDSIVGGSGDGVRFSGNINGADIDVTGNTIEGSENGVSAKGSELSNGTTINVDNNTKIAGTNGVGVWIGDITLGGATVSVSGNLDISAGQEGILLENLTGATANANTIDNTGSDGIKVVNGDTNTINNNFIGTNGGANNIVGDGILVDNSDTATIKGNTITETHSVANAKGSGIQVISSDDTVIGGPGAEGNMISNAGWDGIRVIGGDNVTIDDNDITDSQRAGIYGEDLTNSALTNNIIDGTTEFRGIGLNGGDTIEVSGNTIDNTALDGIIARNVVDLSVIGNMIGANGGANNIGDNGVLLIGSTGSKIQGNTINDTQTNGILLTDASTGALIGGPTNTERNIIARTGTNGIVVNNGSNNVTIQNNVVRPTGQGGVEGEGIILAGLTGTNLVDRNVTGNTFGRGIFADTVSGLTISVNTINNAGNDGIEVKDSDSVQITGNKIGLIAGTDNIEGEGIHVNSSDFAYVAGNQIQNTVLNGILINPSLDVTVFDNTISNTSQHGIVISSGSHRAIVDDNDLAGIGLDDVFDGIHAQGADDIEITNNEITASTSQLGATGHGVFVSGGTSALIEDNTITGANATNSSDGKAGAGLDGIHVVSNADVEVLDNTIQGGNARGRLFGTDRDGGNGANGYGIAVDSSSSADVIGNHLLGGNGDILGGDRGLSAGSDGIRVTSSSSSQINTNEVNHTGGHGIYLNPSHNSVIDGNMIHDVAQNGINVLSSNNVDVTNNNLHAIGENGIFADNTRDIDILANTIGDGSSYGAQQDGIHVTGGRNAEIDGNTIQGADGNLLFLGAGRDGIHVDGNREAVITNNTIQGGDTVSFIIDLPGGSGAGRYGIYANNSGAQGTLNGRDGVQITGNNILNDGLALGALSDGIHVNNSASGLFGDRALVELNTVSGAGGNGIFVDNTSGVQVLTNTVEFAAQDGIHVEDSGIVEIKGNTVTGALGDGVELLRSAIFDISQNIVTGVLGNGILATGVVEGTINTNTVELAGNDGISLIEGALVEIDTNTVTGSLNNGISVVDSAGVAINGNGVTASGNNGIFVDPSIGIDITGNTVLLSAVDGIHALDVLDLTIENNIVALSGDDGIHAQNVADFSIANNIVGGSADNGIELTNVALGRVNNNLVLLSGDDGIDADNVAGVGINGNIIGLSGDDGIDVDNVIGFSIDGNIVGGSSDNGIELTNAALGSVNNNFVILSGDDGIDAGNIALVSIDNNLVSLSGDDGINVEDAILATVNGNFVTLSGDNGIEANDIAFTSVDNNIISLSASNGIRLEDALFASIDNNFVILSGDDGIDAEDLAFVSIDNNIVALSGDDGIDLDNAIGFSIDGNIVGGSADNGIELINAALGSIDNNFVTLSGDDGIEADNVALLSIDNNIVSLSGDDGIDVNNAFFATVNGNIVALSADNGIEASNIAFAGVNNNIVTLSGDDGIDVEDSSNVSLNGNAALFSGENGIEVIDSSFITIAGNTANFSGNAGIYVDPSDNITVEGNTVTSNTIGIQFLDVTDSTISNNIVTGNDIGVQLTNSDIINVINNTISENGSIGLIAEGDTNGLIILSGNTFTDNPIGARFESGAIDMSDTTNPNTFSVTPAFVGPVTGIQFDGAPTSLSVVGNTLGTTNFDGFSTRTIGEAFYVRVEEGTLLTPGGAVITIDATGSSFDGIVPNTFTGLILPQTIFDQIEDRIFDANDPTANGRGDIFIGFAPSSLAFEDFLQDRGFGEFGTSGLSLTVTGLPPTGAIPLNLAAIQPASGEGADADDLANIEPAAGDDGENIQCLSQLEGAFFNGAAAATYSYGDSFEDTLAGAAACGGAI